MLKIFLSYAHEDLEHARRIFRILDSLPAVDVWFDKESLLPGQKWEIEIRKAIKDSRFFLLLLSQNSTNKKGYYQKEIRGALEALDLYPDDEIYLIPARLDDCTPHFEQIRALQYVDLFPESQWKEGIIILKKLLQTHRRETNGNILNSNDVLRFRTHQARFTKNETMYYFLTLTSISHVPIEITHLWYEDSDIHIPVKCKLRSLPKRLEVNEIWESWILLSDIPIEYRHNAYNFFKVKVSTGEVFGSVKDESVPPHGSVPGGDMDGDDLE